MILAVNGCLQSFSQCDVRREDTVVIFSWCVGSSMSIIPEFMFDCGGIGDAAGYGTPIITSR